MGALMSELRERGFYSFCFGPPVPKRIAAAQEYSQANEVVKQIAKKAGAEPAHVYLQPRLAAAGLSRDLAKVLGRACSFYLRESDSVLLEPVVTTIVRVTLEGQNLVLVMSDTRSICFENKEWRESDGRIVVNFLIL
jgi:hypothetical protein